MCITEIEVDSGNESHLTRHGVSIAEVQQVFANRPDIRRNRKNRAGTHVALGSLTAAVVYLFRSLTKVLAESDRSLRGRLASE